MKKIIAAILISCMLSGCASPKTFGGVTAKPYGFANESTNKLSGVEYRISLLNVFAAVLLVETIIVPVYIIGWDLFEPVTFIGNLECQKEFHPVACDK